MATIIWVLLLGLAFTFALARQFDSDGIIDAREGALLLIVVILTALALLCATVYEIMKLRRTNRTLDGVTPPAKPATTTTTGRGAVLREQDASVHTLKRTWGPAETAAGAAPVTQRPERRTLPPKMSIREDQKLPPSGDPEVDRATDREDLRPAKKIFGWRSTPHPYQGRDGDGCTWRPSFAEDEAPCGEGVVADVHTQEKDHG